MEDYNMTTMIKDNRLTGTETRAAQFLNGGPDCKGYQVKVIMDGADINDVVKHALNAGIIVLRKRIKTREQAEALAEGITFAQMVSAAPKDADSMAATIISNPDKLSAENTDALIKILLAKQAAQQAQAENEDQ
jgi:hypothetical protein